MSEKDNQLDKELNKLYELSFHIVPTEGEDGALAKFDEIKGIVEKTATKMVADSKPASLKLRYTMSKTVDSKKQKYDNAFFAWIKFEALTESIEDLKEELDLRNEILRYMVIKSEADTNTSSEDVSRMVSGKELEEKAEDKEEKEEKEEIDTDDDSEEQEDVESEEVEETPEASEEEKTDEIDEAIDELVEEDK